MHPIEPVHRIILADAYPMILKGIQQTLAENDTNFQIMASCHDYNSVSTAVQQFPSDLLLLDLDLPELDVIAFIKELVRTGQRIKIVIYARHVDEVIVCEIIRLGVRGILLKNMAPDLVLQCLRKVAAGGEWLERKAVQSALENLLRQQTKNLSKLLLLTPREQELAGFVSTGMSNKEIARKANLTEGTVKISLNRIFTKLDLKNRVELSSIFQSHHSRIK